MKQRETSANFSDVNVNQFVCIAFETELRRWINRFLPTFLRWNCKSGCVTKLMSFCRWICLLYETVLIVNGSTTWLRIIYTQLQWWIWWWRLSRWYFQIACFDTYISPHCDDLRRLYVNEIYVKIMNHEPIPIAQIFFIK